MVSSCQILMVYGEIKLNPPCFDGSTHHVGGVSPQCLMMMMMMMMTMMMMMMVMMMVMMMIVDSLELIVDSDDGLVVPWSCLLLQ